MASRAGASALVVGGTGPTGPDVVQGLLERGFETTVFHSGQHEVPLPAEVRHVHGDPHFAETIAAALGRSEFDVVVVQYGRLTLLADHLRDRAGHVVAIGASMGAVAPARDERWGEVGRPALVDERDRHLRRPDGGGLAAGIARAEQAFLEAGRAGHFRATYLGYPSLYGPRQPGASEWAVVRRILDGRTSLILPDDGNRLESRGYVHNVSQAPLLAIDRPAVSAGQSYVVSDREVHTMRQRVQFIARHLGAELDLVGMPFDLATPAHPLYRIGPHHRVMQGQRIRDELGYDDCHGAAEALGATVDWLVEAAPAVREAVEEQLGDAFDYAYEDQLVAWWHEQLAGRPTAQGPRYEYSHVYRHPSTPDEAWRRR